MHLKMVTAPTEPAVSLAEFKGHLNNQSDAEDADLQLKLDGATAHVENDLRRCLVTTTFDLYLSDWPCRGYLDMPLGNLQSVEWVKYTDSAGALQAVDPATYKLARTYAVADAEAAPPVVGNGQLDAGIGRIYLAYGQSWPSAALDTGEPIVIRFTCGWEPENVPTPIKQRILMLAAAHFRNRDAFVVADNSRTVAEIALAGDRLTSVYEDRRF